VRLRAALAAWALAAAATAASGCFRPRQLSPECRAFDVGRGEGIEVVEFHAAWCRPCAYQHRILADLRRRHPSVAFLPVDHDRRPDLVECYDVDYLPTVIVKHDGEIVRRFEGLTRGYRIAAWLDP